MRSIVNHNPNIGLWVASKIGFEYIPERMTSIGLIDSETNEILAGVVFYDYTSANVWMHVAVDRGAYGARDFLCAVFHYVFVQLNCLRCSGWVPVCNKAAIRLDTKLGFTIEHILENGGSDGDHALMGMRREDCRWIKEECHNGL